MDEGKIRVGIITKNRREILKKCLASVIAQDYPNFEIFVFDDGSTDDTISLQTNFPDVVWQRSEKSIGYRRARNIIMDCTAEYFCSLDDDAWFLENDGLSRAMMLFEKNPALAAVAYDIIEPTKPHQNPPAAAVFTNSFIGCGHLLRIEAVKKIGNYENFPGDYGVEEKDLCLRLLDAGFEVLLQPGNHIWHDKAFAARNIAAQHQSGVANDFAFILLRCPCKLLWWALPKKILGHLVFCQQFASKAKNKQISDFEKEIVAHIGRWGFVKPMLQGCWQFLSKFFTLLKSRHAVSAPIYLEYTRRAEFLADEISASRQTSSIATPPRCAVIIASRNRQHELQQTLLKLTQLDPLPDEVLVCLDQTADDSLEMLEKLKSELIFHLKIIENKHNRGSIASRNLLLDQCQSELALLLDDDSYPLQGDFFAKIKQKFQNQPRLAIASFPQQSDEFPLSINSASPYRNSRMVKTFSNSGAVIRCDIYHQLGGFAEVFYHAYEEPDFALRCIAENWVVREFGDLHIRHHYSQTERDELRTHHYHARNELWSALLRCPAVLLPAVISYRVIRQMNFVLKHNVAWIWHEPKWWWQAICGSQAAWKQRRALKIKQYLRWLVA